ncbi:MAG: hypothetical protein ACOVT5_16010 [Armatimonadaceae bacterium]
MCSVKTPSVKKPEATNTEVPYLRNSYFDGVGPLSQATAKGAQSFRINPGSARTPSTPPASSAAIPGYTPPSGSTGGGGYMPNTVLPTYVGYGQSGLVSLMGNSAAIR